MFEPFGDIYASWAQVALNGRRASLLVFHVGFFAQVNSFLTVFISLFIL